MKIAAHVGTMRIDPANFPTDQQPRSADLICLSHLRWNFVFQRPQHLMTRYARTRRVFFVEEPLCANVAGPSVTIDLHDGVFVVVPRLPHGYGAEQSIRAQRAILDQVIPANDITRFVLWCYTPLALKFSSHLHPEALVYDCMDELSAFKNAPQELGVLEEALLNRADVVFTGGHSLYEAKKHLHHNIHPMPSSVDAAHFASARTIAADPADQCELPRPRLGFFGVLDERLDLPLLRGLAETRPDWQLVMIGPVVKIDPADLPRLPNIHYLGAKRYEELPAYLSGWDLALLLFARNHATRFISPTKTPEYLAAGKPVISTSIRDVVTPYGDRDLVRIADSVEDFVAACASALREVPEPRRVRADVFLRGMSWDRTWAKTAALVDAVTSQPSLPAAGVNPTPSLRLGA